MPFDLALGALVVLDETSACLQPADRSRPATTYAVFALPRQDGVYSLTFESLYTNGIVSKPAVWLLDADGRVVRTLADREFEHLGTGERAGMRLGGREAFLVAASDTGVAGSPLRLHYGLARLVQYASRSSAPIIIYTPPRPDIPVAPGAVPAIYGLNGSFMCLRWRYRW